MNDAAVKTRGIAVPADPVLPQLALALDTDAMSRLLSAQLEAAGASARLLQCKVVRVKYRPGRNCVVLYRARLRDAAHGGTEEQFFHAGLYTPEEAAHRFEAARRAVLAPRHGAAVTLLRRHSMVLWAFPNERKLRALACLSDPASLHTHLLPPLARGRWGRDAVVAACCVEPVSYFPEHAYTACVDAELQACADTAAHWKLFAKADADGRGARTLAAMQALWASPARRDDRLRMARPLAYDAQLCTLWQEALPGSPVEALCGNAGPPPATAQRVGASLAALHAVALDGLAQTGVADALAQARRATGVIGRALPCLAQPADELAEQLARRAPSEVDCKRATLHGDLHLNNLLDHASGIGFVDFDDLRAGPPAAELGSFVAGLVYRALLHRKDARSADSAVAAFLDGYERHAPWRVPLAEIRWHTAAALIGERAWRCVTSIKPGRLDTVDEMLAAAAALLTAGRSAAPLAR